jgi:hypothetical protein
MRHEMSNLLYCKTSSLMGSGLESPKIISEEVENENSVDEND